MNQTLLQRFPEFELSYEVHPHKTVFKHNANPSNNRRDEKREGDKVRVAMPYGRRFYLWFTVDPTGEGLNAVYKLPFVSRQERPKECYRADIMSETKSEEPLHLYFGTVVTAFCVQPGRNSKYVMTDVHWFRGVCVSGLSQRDKWACAAADICPHFPNLMMPVISGIPGCVTSPALAPAYNVHHVQERPWFVKGPFVRCDQRSLQITSTPVGKSPETSLQNGAATVADKPADKLIEVSQKPLPKGSAMSEHKSEHKSQHKSKQESQHKSQHKSQQTSVKTFVIKADPAYDLYKLFARDPAGGALHFVEYACIVDKKTSVWLNSVFRRFAENARLDAAEESDDEEEFEDVRENKYTDLEKEMEVECHFVKRLQRWVPVVPL